MLLQTVFRLSSEKVLLTIEKFSQLYSQFTNFSKEQNQSCWNASSIARSKAENSITILYCGWLGLSWRSNWENWTMPLAFVRKVIDGVKFVRINRHHLLSNFVNLCYVTINLPGVKEFEPCPSGV